MRKAVIDMGTNTFHMLVLEQDSNEAWVPLYRKRVYVRLAEQGLGWLAEDAQERGLEAMREFAEVLGRLGIEPGSALAFGTAALRSASNAPDFFKRVFEETGIPAEAISGEREAELIYHGVRHAVPWPDPETVLIMDIGGGSVEFILANKERLFWRGSFNVGVAVLYHAFHKSDPIQASEVEAIEDFLEKELASLWEAASMHNTQILVGAAGAFDTIDLFALDPATKPQGYGYLPVEHFEPLYAYFVKSTEADRRNMPLLLPERVEMVVAAVILIRKVLQRVGIKELYTSEYSMKEGMLLELG
ncbi:MAG: hypothetical protein R2792_09225 [Saprospiraceae bacterium]